MLYAIQTARLRWQEGDISDAAFAGTYFLVWQMHRHEKYFASRKSRAYPSPDMKSWLTALLEANGGKLDHQLTEWFAKYQFRGVSHTVPTALASWLAGNWDLLLMTHIPKPKDVLEMQVAGRRPVTVISDPDRMAVPILGKENGFAFLVHDLEHAYKFYFDEVMHLGQRTFFRRLLDLLTQGKLDFIRVDREFEKRLDYLMSDMNTHVMHGIQYFRAVLVQALLRQEGKSQHELLSSAAWQTVEHLTAQLAVGIVDSPT